MEQRECDWVLTTRQWRKLCRIIFLDVTQLGQKHIRRTKQFGLSSIEDHDPGQGPDQMRALCCFPSGLGMRGGCTNFFGNVYFQFVYIYLYVWVYSPFPSFIEPFGTLWSQARELFTRKESVYQKCNNTVKKSKIKITILDENYNIPCYYIIYV